MDAGLLARVFSVLVLNECECVCTFLVFLCIALRAMLFTMQDNHTIHVRDVRISAGAEFVVALTGDIMTMPGTHFMSISSGCVPLSPRENYFISVVNRIHCRPAKEASS